MKWEVKIRHTEAEEWISLDLGDENPYITLQAFDGLKYSFTSFFRLHFSTHRYDWKEKESFQEYKERIHSDEKKKKNVSITAIIGGVFMIGAIICLIIYETI